MTRAQGPTGSERRPGPRFLPKDGVSATCCSGLSSFGYNLAVLDVSENGVRLALKSPLARGDVVVVGLMAAGWPRPLKRLGVVVWCDRAEGGAFQAGILLSRPFSHGQLQALCHIPGALTA